jgi:hypothetical protein
VRSNIHECTAQGECHRDGCNGFVAPFRKSVNRLLVWSVHPTVLSRLGIVWFASRARRRWQIEGQCTGTTDVPNTKMTRLLPIDSDFRKRPIGNSGAFFGSAPGVGAVPSDPHTGKTRACGQFRCQLDQPHDVSLNLHDVRCSIHHRWLISID